jgi:flagellar motor protein MotB
MDNLLSLLMTVLPKDFAALVSQYLGEPEAPTQTSLSALLPALLGAISQKGSTPSDAAGLLNLLKGSDVDAGIINNIGSLFSGSGTGANELVNIGAGLVNQLFGNKQSALSDSLASMSGIKSSSAMKLLGLAAPVVLGYLKNYIFGKNLDPTSTARLLSCQGKYLEGRLDNNLVKALGYASPAALLSGLPCPEAEAKVSPAYVPEPEHRRHWLPWLLGLLALLGLLYLWQAFSKPVHQPTAVAPGVAPVAYCLPANIYFEVGLAVLDAADQETIIKVAQCAKKEGLKVALTGYTDRTGDWNANVELAKNRAKVVRDALIANGLPETGITLVDPREWTGTTTGTGSDREARRVEITKQ